MKLLYCQVCDDIIKLRYEDTFCECGKSWGRYQSDGLYAVIGGKALVIGIGNQALAQARRMHEAEPDEQFTLTAWLMREGAGHVVREA